MSQDPVTKDEIRAMRRSYGDAGLETLPANPFEAFAMWLKQAHENTVIVEANAMVLSTLSSDSQINTRTVLVSHSSQITILAKHMQLISIQMSRCYFLGMQWNVKFQLVVSQKKFQNKNLMITSQPDHGDHKLVLGQVRNLHHWHLVLN
jgi:hypothetical protein